MQMYQRVFLITSTLESSTATSFVSCLLVLSYDLFSLKVKCAEANRHDATVNSIPQEEEMQLCLWDVIDVPKINIKKELKVGPAYFLLPYFIPYAPTTWHPISSTTCSTLTPGPPGSRAAR